MADQIQPTNQPKKSTKPKTPQQLLQAFESFLNDVLLEVQHHYVLFIRKEFWKVTGSKYADRKINQILQELRRYHSKSWSFWAKKTEGSKALADEVWK